ncbi:MAG: GNAT family N-acetyltransferase [Saprospiraceae bacterium]|nr:GNAT family N-acetyltransferase [Saprospiraceae bacterium]
MYKKSLPSGLVIQNTEAHHAKGLAALQQTVFPTLSPEELMGEAHYLQHIRIFPEGQFVVLDGERAVGMSTTMRYHFSLAQHTFLEISGNLWMTTHEPDGDWLYGLDVGVDPEYRGMGLAREIYRARQETCRTLGLKGQITVGMMNGYQARSHELSTDAYYELLKKGEINDPTVSVQLRMGFEIQGLIHDYLDDPKCGNCGVLMTLDANKPV